MYWHIGWGYFRMIKNYLKIAIRQLKKQKMYAAIKIGGFALSIAACLLIALFIQHELSYDKSNPDGDRVFRMIGIFNDDTKLNKGTSFPAPMARTLKADMPEVELAGRLMPSKLFDGAGSNQIREVGTKENFYEEGFCFADPEIIELLHIPIIKGDPKKALREPFSLLISRKKAEKFFPGQNPVGKMLVLNNRDNRPIRISGVMEDFPGNSHLQYDYFISMVGTSFWDGEQDTWMASNYDIYVRLAKGTDPKAFAKKATGIVLTQYMIPELKKAGEPMADNFLKKAWLETQRLQDIHLTHDVEDALSHGDNRFVWLFGSVAVFILMLACINFINLSTARSANRAREVGLRKAVGSLRSSLITQFLTESVLYSVLSFVLAVVIAWLLIPYFNQLSQKSLTIPWLSPWFLPVLVGGALLTGIAAGLYPSLYLSSFRPVNVLKGDVARGSKSSMLRNVLVVFQFTCSIILIIGTIVIFSQTNFLLNRKVGFDKDRVVMIQGTNTLGNQVKSFETELMKQSTVQSVTVSDFLPVGNTKRNMNTFWEETQRQTAIGTPVQVWTVDHNYLNTLGMKLISGRNFQPDMPTDSQAVVVNAALVKKMGLKDPLDKVIVNWTKYRIIGVVEDFNFENMRAGIDPLCFVLGSSPTMIAVKVKTADMSAALDQIKTVWGSFMPNQQIRYSFLDENFEQMYADVKRMQRIFGSFSLLAIVIACLGLFALSAFMAEQRNKEISIRKVLGASVAQINGLLSRDFLILVGIAIVVASPIAWFGMQKWLQDYVYRISLTWWMFGLAALIVLLIALATISFQSIKAALSNPIRGLRSE
ncbi:ABC transporter permease [Flavihumibacter petaseus]|uniref:Putative ABC transporter permease protein n=1 Tax=Flavihumibacter petaseus NBRC 106054 TaxID=1220578 RepID=A0A0E9MWX2_9BACT|nr:ABC transporter permease [Flavihumibacter petaseus]GAO41998.1 putative ABC transporter permease protein [Flavihumibacter petaseus NBRC 106054]